MTDIRRVQQGHPPQPTIQIPVFVPPQIRAEWVLGRIYERAADGTERLIERRQVRYGEELSFFTEVPQGNIRYEVIGLDSEAQTVASKDGPAEHLDYLHSLHLNPI